MFGEPLSRILINHGLCSVRSVSNFLSKNEVLVNGLKAAKKELEVFVEKDDIIVNGKLLDKFSHLYFMLNKPLGYVCARSSDRHPVVYDLFPLADFNIPEEFGSFHSIGRLDSDTEGLLLFTTNGSFSHHLTDPAFHVKKTYEVTLEQDVSVEEMKLYECSFRNGIVMPAEKKASESKALPAQIEFSSSIECKITVQEGKFHQVRRMILGAGNRVVHLKRISFGELFLDGDLAPGEYRKLSREDLLKTLK